MQERGVRPRQDESRRRLEQRPGRKPGEVEADRIGVMHLVKGYVRRKE
jgi:hypothetical protein